MAVLKKLGDELMDEYIDVLRYLGEELGVGVVVEPHDYAVLVSEGGRAPCCGGAVVWCVGDSGVVCMGGSAGWGEGVERGLAGMHGVPAAGVCGLAGPRPCSCSVGRRR